MLVLKEREREYKDFNKLEKDAMQIFQKGKTSRPSRKGVIREIMNIKCSSRSNLDALMVSKKNQSVKNNQMEET